MRTWRRTNSMKHYYNEFGFSNEHKHEERDTTIVRAMLKREYDRIVSDFNGKFEALSAAMTDYAFSLYRSLYGMIVTYEADISLGSLSGFARENLSEDERNWFTIMDGWYDADMVPREFLLYANDILLRSVIDILLSSNVEGCSDAGSEAIDSGE